ncbi:MAG TPA: type II toxin-antitoxin system VapC family toxin [Pyrinomonadaceae bacterium]|jgi:predicted nucleic acid-binding protein|nr:type II toxin-antitoxin system VapC family toxin [Pyrinomonadaceae bacterium]
MSYLVDTNVLLRLVQKNHPMKPDARRALVSLRKQGEELCITPQNVIEFYAVATRPLTDNGLGLSADEAAREIRKLKRIFKLRPDSQAIFIEWEQLVAQYQVMGKQAHDTRLVAAMKSHGLTHILTFNVKDFKRFIDIAAVSPQAVT